MRRGERGRAGAVCAGNYWSHGGRHPALLSALEALVPTAGRVDDPDENPCLERFRRAANCYYDLYNNGLCNRGREFKEIFGFVPDRGDLTRAAVTRTEAVMNRLIRAAAKEQKVGV